jgi:hypothetical protein
MPEDHGYLRGNKKISLLDKTPTDDNLETKLSERRTLMDLIVETVAKCSEEYDDAVHIQVKLLHTLFGSLLTFPSSCCRFLESYSQLSLHKHVKFMKQVSSWLSALVSTFISSPKTYQIKLQLKQR